MAIAYDNVSSPGHGQANSFSWPHTTSGSKRILFVAIVTSDPVEGVSTVTYNGNSLTLISRGACIGNDVRAELWYLANPPSGSNTVAVTLAGISRYIAQALSYCGVAQTTPIDGSGSATWHDVVPYFAATATVNVITPNSWVMAIIGVRKLWAHTVTTDPPDTQRLQTWGLANFRSLTSADKNGPQTIGNKSISFTATGCASERIVAFKPYVWGGKVGGILNPAKVMGVDRVNIAKIKGVS